MKKEPIQGTLFPEMEDVQPPSTSNKNTKVSKKSALKEENQSLKEENDQLKAQNEQLQLQLEALKRENTSMLYKVQAYDELIKTPSLMTIGVIAKNYGMTAIALNKYLEAKGIQFCRGEIWTLYAKYDKMGLTAVKWYPYSKDSNGQDLFRPHTYWTSKGLIFIRDLLKADGIIK